MRWLGRFLGKRIGRNFNAETESLVTETMLLGNEVAQWKADSELLHAIQGSIFPAALVLGVILVANPLITLLGGGVEPHRIGIGALALVAFIWACAVSISGVAWFLRHMRLMFITGLSPRGYLRLVIALSARDWLREQADAIAAGTWREFLAGFQKATSSQPEILAGRLADQISATLWRHVALRLGYVLAPMLVALIYYRMVVYPSFLGASAWLTMLYPLAALIDAVAGTQWRQQLLGG